MRSRTYDVRDDNWETLSQPLVTALETALAKCAAAD